MIEYLLSFGGNERIVLGRIADGKKKDDEGGGVGEENNKPVVFSERCLCFECVLTRRQNRKQVSHRRRFSFFFFFFSRFFSLSLFLLYFLLPLVRENAR